MAHRESPNDKKLRQSYGDYRREKQVVNRINRNGTTIDRENLRGRTQPGGDLFIPKQNREDD